MSIVDYGNDYEYARSRLENSLVLTKDGSSGFIETLSVKDGVSNMFMPSKGGYVKIGLEELDLSPPKLGYRNEDTTDWTYRLPNRYWKQGLTTSNTRGTKGLLSMTSISLHNLVTNNFPTVKQAFKLNQAFCRDFCFKKAEAVVNLMYRTELVGEAKKNNVTGNIDMKLHEEYEYLKETLQEQVNV